MMYLLQYSLIVIALVICVLMPWYLARKVVEQDREHNKKLEELICETRDSLQKYMVLSDLLWDLYQISVSGTVFPELYDLEIEIRVLLEESDNVTAEDIHQLHRSFERLCVRMRYYVMFVQVHKLTQIMDAVTAAFIEEELPVQFGNSHGIYRTQNASLGQSVQTVESDK